MLILPTRAGRPGIASEFTAHDEIRELGEPERALAERCQRGMGLAQQFLGKLARPHDSHRRDESRLAAPGVLAGGLAERCRARIGVEHIVYDLECESDA